jgi:ribonuclease PH
MNETTRRPHGRAADALRPVTIELDPMKFAEGSALIEVGDTKVLVSATLEKRVPPFLIDSGRGWVTGEYAMLPRATSTRSRREVKQGRQSGRSAEIQRLIGRSLRAAVDLTAMPERTLILDCDVLQADGGTRTASITGAYVAAVSALAKAALTGDIERWPLARQIAAISVGVVDGHALLDLEAVEDQAADVDMNVVATAEGEIVEVQGTGERGSFPRAQFDQLLDMALCGVEQLARAQTVAVAHLVAEVEDVLSRPRRKASPKDEKDLWGRP